MPQPKTTAPPLAERTPAHRVITPELLAATVPAPLSLGRRFHREWFAVLALACDGGLVLVFDDVVIGRPDPLVLEAANHTRLLRQAELDCDVDEWADAEADPDLEPLTIPERVIGTMQGFQEAERLRTSRHVYRILLQTLRPERSDVPDLVGLLLEAERLLADVADFVRIGQGMAVAARPSELCVRRRWRAA